jgi:hypothetical protein
MCVNRIESDRIEFHVHCAVRCIIGQPKEPPFTKFLWEKDDDRVCSILAIDGISVEEGVEDRTERLWLQGRGTGLMDEC